MAMALRVVVPPHPLLNHWLLLLRDQQTPTPLYGTAMAELGRWLSYEALRDWIPTRELSVQTAVGVAQGQIVDASVPLLAVVAIPDSLGLWQGGQQVLPSAQLGTLSCTDAGLQHLSLPTTIPERCGVLLYWSALAAPEPLLAVLDQLAALGVSGARLRLITAVAAAPALHSIGEAHEALTIYTAAIDSDLDDEGRISPGIGTINERLLGFSNCP